MAITRIGITGHQRLDDPAAWPWVEEIVGRELDAAPSPVVVVTSLAVGADQLIARLGIARGATVHAVLPFAGIERTFAPEDLQAYRHLVSQATVEVLQTHGTDEDAYLAAGRRVAELSDVMIAVWDAKPAKGKGGTADIVAYTVASGVPVVHINPVDRTVTRLQPLKPKSS
jgi:hypothetical protein